MRACIAMPLVAVVFTLLAARVHAADAPAAPGKAAGPATPRTVGVETAAQLKAVHAARAKLDIAPGDAPAAAPGVLTNDQLLDMVEKMGYDMKTETYPDGKKYVTVTIKRGTWTFNISLEVAGDMANVWMRAYLMEWTEAQQKNPDRLLKLMTQNHAQWPSYFAFFGGRYLYLLRPTLNVGIKPASLRKSMESFMDVIQSTQPDWDSSSWTDAAPAAPGPTADAKK